MDKECYYRVSVKGIAFDSEGRILLTREDNDKWDIIGGGLEHNEDPIAGLRREVLEETGLKLSYVSRSPLYFVTAPKQSTKIQTFTANVIYEIKLTSMDFTASSECQELKFFSLYEIEGLYKYPNIAQLVELIKLQATPLT
jgi:8-oxo-dGTP diphosphatase